VGPINVVVIQQFRNGAAVDFHDRALLQPKINVSFAAVIPLSSGRRRSSGLLPMSALNLKESGYSVDIRVQLYVSGHVLPIAQLGPDFLVPRDPIEHSPCEGEIAMSVFFPPSERKNRMGPFPPPKAFLKA